jgi:DNA-binding transcriptional regulator GbsR (MarR family)
MNKELMKAQDIFLDEINHVCKKLGLNNVMAQLYAILYLSNKPLSLDDMVERLKISKGSASVNIRALENYGAVRRVWIRGSRKDYYEADTDIMRVIMDRVNLIGKIRLSEIDTMTKSCYQILNSADPVDKDESAAIKAFKQKLDKIETLRKQAHSLFNLLNSGILRNLLSKKPAESEKESSFAASVG